MVARTVRWTDYLKIVAQVLNTSDIPFVPEPGQPIAILRPTIEHNPGHKASTAFVNHISLNRDDEKEFSAIIEEFSITPELNPAKRPRMLEVL